MKKTKAILIATVVCTMASVCWGQSYWKRTYGGSEYEIADAITPTQDGNFIVAGSISAVNGDQNIYILKITPFGDTLWTKTYDGTAYAITQTPDGNFILAGSAILKITPYGDALWTKTYGGMAFAITPTPDGNFIVAGGNNNGAYLRKITPNGDTLWTKTYGGNDCYQSFAITPTSDGNFIVAGSKQSFCAGDWDVYIMKINLYGDTLWTKTYGGNGDDWASAITPTPDGNFIVAGLTRSFGHDDGDIYFIKIKPNGDTLWTKICGGTDWDEASAITTTKDGNFIVVGQTFSFHIGYPDIYILKITSHGDTLWTKTYGGTGVFEACAITPTPNGDFIVMGSTGGNILFLSIINDRYAYKDSLFTFKIPVSGDSLSHGYSPLKVPTGMTVSTGGTISWTPKIDSVYMDHAEFLVMDDIGNKDTLTFYIFVNSKNKPTAIKAFSPLVAYKNQPFSIMQTSSSQIKFTLPSGTSNIDIYDINGRCVQRIKPLGAQAVWNGLNAAGSPVSSGRYFAKIKEGKTSRMGKFTVVR